MYDTVISLVFVALTRQRPVAPERAATRFGIKSPFGNNRTMRFADFQPKQAVLQISVCDCRKSALNRYDRGNGKVLAGRSSSQDKRLRFGLFSQGLATVNL